MGNIEKRPYAGTWVLNNRTVVKYTPDCLIFINGDTSLPGCARCRGRIEVQKFVTGVSVEAGTDPMSHSASIQLALPRVQGKQVFIDGYNILRPGLEVHIFMRGYFPIRGMFSHLANSQSGPDAGASPAYSNRLDLTKYATYPYYPVFHGLITQVSYEYSDGFYYGSLNCTSLLHFWQYVNITTSGAWMAQDKRPTNDQGRPTLFGHNFNNTHPFAIMYTLYKDVHGSAAGVDFALSEESNLNSVAASTGNDGRQIFSQVATYWEQRFKTRVQSLRMYGVNGQLFNAAQQAWLGTNRDVQGLLTSSTANDPTTTQTATDPFSARYSVAKALGLQQAGADFTYSPLIQQNNEFFNLSVLDMFAFNQSVGEMGAVNLWQTTYQTKMDIAQQVMEVTGYEFYQDVDGDLVFKPPFWNLDTATNRYYRLEDSDIINITFVEKEPNATYIIVRGVWIPGLTAESVTPGEVLTKRGLYIDYKLVAQFGWRPAPTLELTYVIDPKVLFWIGVARLDALNVDTFSATATIPIRAELRPGFPVYIPFADCYYYISQLSHSFAFGGQCTTTLVLVCRRAKWHAPGFLSPATPGESAIWKIRLDRPDLPPRPLEAFVNDVPRWVGFPNVVMALDPRKINPNFSVVGIGIDYFDNVDAPADLLFGWIVRDIALLDAFEIDVPSAGPDGQTVIQDPTQVTRLRFRNSQDEWVSFTVDDLIAGFASIRSASEDLNQTRDNIELQEAVVGERDRAFNATAQANRAAGKDPNSSSSDRATQTDRLDVLRGEEQQQERKFRQTINASPSANTLVQIFEALQPDSNKPIRRKIDGIPGSDVRLSYFETLSALKGQYLAGSVPGNYRYFSCSHPDEAQQGMPILEWDDGERSKTVPGTATPAPGGSVLNPRRRTRSSKRNKKSRGQKKRAVSLFAKVEEELGIPGVALYLEQWAESESRWVIDAANPKSSARGWFQALRGRRPKQRAYPPGLSKYGDQSHETLQFTPGTATASALSGSKGRLLRQDFRRLPREQQTYMNLRIKGGGRLPGEGDNGTPSVAYVTSQLVSFPGCKNISDVATGDTQTYKAAQVRYFRSMCRLGLSAEDAVAFANTPITGELRRKWLQEVPRKQPGGRESFNARQQERIDALADKLMQFDSEFVGANAFLIPEEEDGTNSTGATEPTTQDAATDQNVGTTDAPAADGGQAIPPVVVSQGRPPSVKERDLSLNVARKVVQFLPTTKSPGANRRAPEVILGVGKCRKGILLARGPNRTPEVVTTDQIQRISFVRHQAGKFMGVVGTSQNSGGSSFKAIEYQKNVNTKFAEAVQNLSDPEQTVESIFGPVYNQIREDLASVDIPRFAEDGTLLLDEDNNNILLTPFEDVLTVENSRVPASVQEQLAQAGIPTDTDPYFLGDFTFTQLSQIEGYKVSSKPSGDPGNWKQPSRNAASNIAAEVVRQIERGNNLGEPDNWPGYLAVIKEASEPKEGKQERIASVNNAFDEATSKAFGPNETQDSVAPGGIEEKTVSEGKLESPIHSPVFPVSDEKGYEHYGAYRYGRGLSVDPGGTWEFLHSGKDPFRNVTAQTAEEFLNVLTLVKTGRLEGDTSFFNFAAARDAAVDTVLKALNLKQDPLSTEGLSPGVAAQGEAAQAGATATVGGDSTRAVGLSEFDRAQVDESVRDLAQVVTALGQTARGRDTLRELLEANGDDPNILKGQTFNIEQTQFARNFVNFAVNFGKSPVFKTTASNAAYRLADLTSHLLNRAGQVCICRGTDADVTLEAYSQDRFEVGPGIDPETEKAEAYANETAIQQQTPAAVVEKEVQGAIVGNSPDASTFQETVTPGQGNVLPSLTDDAGVVSGAEGGNNPTTVPLEEIGTTDLQFDPDTQELTGATVVTPDGPVDVLGEVGPGIFPDVAPGNPVEPDVSIAPADPIDALSPGEQDILEEATGFTRAQLSYALTTGQLTQEEIDQILGGETGV